MFGFRLSVKQVAGVLLAASMASGAVAVQAQTTRRTRRESSANRKSRIERTIAETYSHRFEVAGGGGYLRFQSGSALQKNNEITFFMTGTYFLNPKLGIIADVRGAYGNAKIGNPVTPTSPNLGYNPKISEYPFMGGVAYRVYAKEKIAVSVTGEGGAAIGKFDGDAKGLQSPKCLASAGVGGGRCADLGAVERDGETVKARAVETEIAPVDPELAEPEARRPEAIQYPARGIDERHLNLVGALRGVDVP